MSSELYVRIPATYGDLVNAPPGSPMGALLEYDCATGHLLNLHLQMVLWSHRHRTAGHVSRGAARALCRPASPRIADRDAGRLVKAGLIYQVDDSRGYFVPAAEESMRRHAMPDISRHVTVAPAKLGDMAIVMGAAQWVRGRLDA